MINRSLFSSKSSEWETPQEVFNYWNLDMLFFFDLDVCASHNNHKCTKYFTKEDDGLTQDWGKETCWMNPPYGREIRAWVKKAYESNTTVVGLLPARTDTTWFWDWVQGKAEVRFVRGRLKFGGCKNSAPFPSMIAIWRPR